MLGTRDFSNEDNFRASCLTATEIHSFRRRAEVTVNTDPPEEAYALALLSVAHRPHCVTALLS